MVSLLEEQEFQECVRFHGHICPGLSSGYRAARAALKWLEETRAADEELVAIVETDSCAVDAIQVLTGCTFGKGNFIYHDTGKSAFTFLSRKTGRGLRLLMKENVLPPDVRHQQLTELFTSGRATKEEEAEFWKLHEARSIEMLEKDPEEIFHFQEITKELPPKARIEVSVKCDRCSEPVMASKLIERDGKKLCRDCAAG